jgi:hypothetical protein
MKLRIFIFSILPIVIIFGCDNHSTAPKGDVNFALEFKMVKEPPSPSLFDPRPGNQHEGRALLKASRLVEDRVLTLHCDDDTSSEIAVDASAYNNNALLRNTSIVASPNKSALAFNGNGSFAVVPHSPELNGVKGSSISAMIYPMDTIARTEQVLFSKHDLFGGYTVGLVQGRLFCRYQHITQGQQLTGNVTLTTNEWHTIRILLGEGILISVDGKPDTSATDSLASSSADLIIGAEQNSLNYANFFYGYLDDIFIDTRTEYADLDLIRIAVIDLSNFDDIEKVMNSDLWRQYEHAWQDFYSDTSAVMTWENWTGIWGSYFPIISDQSLSINQGMAEGTVQGVEGLNYLLVGGVYQNKMIYEGFGYGIGKSGETTNAEIYLFQVDF